MNKVTPLAPGGKVTGSPNRQNPANEAAPSPTALLAVFRQELLEFGPALMMCDLKGQVTWANAASRRISETRIDGGIIGERLRLSEIAEEIDLRRAAVFRDWDLQAGSTLQRLRVRFEPLTEAGGTLVGFAAMMTLLQDGGGSGDEVTTIIDRHMDFVRLSSDWMWETDAAFNIRLVSQRVVSALGMVPQQLVGRNLLELVASDPLRDNLRRRLVKLSAFRDLPFDTEDATGRRKLFLMSAVPVFDAASGEVTAYRGTASDITELTRREEGLRAAKETAETANRAKTQFLANMSHELMTPLNAIIGFADVMRMGLLGPVEHNEYRDYIRDIHGSAVNLMGIINDILDVSRIENGQAEINESVCNLEELIDSVSRLIQERLQIQGLDLVVQLPPRLPRVQADKRKLKQMLANLLANAVKFTPRGGRITITAGLTAPGNIEITVRDTGIGISPEDIERVMHPFAQADSGLNRRYEGTGLGLSLSLGLARLHGGDLRLESVPGNGTDAIITLPASRIIDGSHLTTVK